MSCFLLKVFKRKATTIEHLMSAALLFTVKTLLYSISRDSLFMFEVMICHVVVSSWYLISCVISQKTWSEEKVKDFVQDRLIASQTMASYLRFSCKNVEVYYKLM